MANRSSGWRWFLLILAVLAAGFIAWWDSQRSIQAIPMAVAERLDIHTGVVTNGKAEPIEYRDVRAEIEGQVSEIPVHDGTEVRQGEKLMEITQKQIPSEIEQARAELVEAEDQLRLLKQGGTQLDIRQLQTQIDLARRERDEAARLVTQNDRLIEKGAVSRMELQQSRDRLATAEADLAVLEQKKSGRYDPEEIAKAEAVIAARRAALNLVEAKQRSSSVTSPLRGTVYSLSVRLGDLVRPGDLLLRVGDFRQLRVRVYVDEPDLGRVTLGQPVLVSWDGLPGKQWRGQVDRLPSEIKDLGTRKVGEVSCVIPNSHSELLPNMNLNVDIITADKPNVLTIPREALFGSESNPHVFLVQDGRLLMRPVQIGITNLTRVEILQGLKDGDQVAVASEKPLRSGMRVRNDES